jgi:glycosyltransferase involved in cell wall biosynthesis
MTIAHIGPPHLPILFTQGGATERRMRETAAQQVLAGCRVLLYSAEAEARVTEYRGAEVRAVECKRRGLARAAEFMIKSIRDVRRHKPDVIHFHTLPEGAAFARIFGGDLSAKTILSFDYYVFRRGKQNPLFAWYRRALSSFSELLPVSNYCRRESASYWSIPETRMEVLYNGVSLDQFHPDAAAGAARRAALGIAPHESVLLYVGRVCEQKGSDLLLQAYSTLRASRSSVRLVVAGPIGQFGHSTGAAEFAKKLQQQNGLYLGPVEEEILPSVYNIADVFVLPTRTSEMFGMAAIEAQACGRPVVCSDDGGLPEVVSSRSGLLFPSGNLAALTAQLASLLDSPEQRVRFQDEAVRNARRFSWQTVTAQLQQVYERN